MNFLKLIGAVSAAEHGELHDLLNRVSRERNDALIAAGEADERFKKAITDLAEQSEKATRLEATVNTADNQTIAALRSRDEWKETATNYAAEIAALRPDAQKWRDRAARELQRGQAKRDAAGKGLPVSNFTKPIPAPTKAVAAKGKK